ncbi:SIMPL domain-containing protein [uncultured Tateyamaria sp.]|uniref:SIMPL domain-containing protein n=1 Tax=uncultured Tateyamaria sp. TaxID=455651 RepID=UPI002607AAD3|nr:SIMPL domain-containing protein [uncultured Tateyamaria sp.]
MKLTLVSAAIWMMVAGAVAAQDDGPVLSVSGEGRVAVAPDMAMISLGVVHVDKTAGDAMAKVSADATALIAVLSEQGIEARDIQTSQLNVNPVWSGFDSTDRQITGFEARNAVTVRVRDLDGLGGVLDQVLEVGANTFNGLQFQLQDPSAAEAEARAAAVRDAMEKAAQLSEAAGVTLGPVLSLSEGGQTARPEMFAAARSADVPIAAGELAVTARVSMSFSLEP